MNRKKKPTEEVKMSTWEVFRRLVRDARPIYEQVRDGLRRLMVSGIIQEGEQLPTVRAMGGLGEHPRSADRSAAADLRSTGGGVPAEEYRGHRKDGPDEQCGE